MATGQTVLYLRESVDDEQGIARHRKDCRALCDRQNCRSRAFPPLEHRLALDPTLGSDTPYRFEPKR